MGRIPGAERYRPYTKYLLIVLVLGAIVWGTPHTMIANSKELAAMGGSHHPLLGALGVMSAKNSAVNLMILATFLSFLMYRRGNKQLVVPWAATGTKIQAAMFALAAGIVLFYGIRGYFVEAIVRIGFSVYQVLAVLACIVGVTVIDVMIGRGAKAVGEIQWGKMPARSQYALFILAVTFTWLMGLMGFARSGIRQYWHVWQGVAGHGGHEQVRRHPGPGLCLADDQSLRTHFPQPGGLRVLAGRARREVDLRAGGEGGPACGSLTSRSWAS